MTTAGVQPRHRTRWLTRQPLILLGTGQPSLSWNESVDAALCFGWIDGVKKTVDADAYMHRFTPRKPASYWSAVNTRRMNELIKTGLVADAGRAAFERRDREKTKRYSFEREAPAFDPAIAREFKANLPAWTFFRAQPPGYQKLMTFVVMSAKQDATRRRRLDRLITLSSEGKRWR